MKERIKNILSVLLVIFCLPMLMIEMYRYNRWYKQYVSDSNKTNKKP